MYPVYYVAAIMLCLIALIGTIKVAKDMTAKEKEENTGEAELNSLKEEKTGADASIRRLTIIYAITFVITILLVWIFIF
ncbi:hypothetical protein [Halobacillus sp. Marseille-Q1614]|uniref:hypothetical protein n=1 Tax=Halobacillus sp. Marseille-Q1614 TaxID=2709134 RepID=UPI0015701DC6|nr:hypothetical protein [Halobacillus sp. Marseille-Q1614]